MLELLRLAALPVVCILTCLPTAARMIQRACATTNIILSDGASNPEINSNAKSGKPFE